MFTIAGRTLRVLLEFREVVRYNPGVSLDGDGGESAWPRSSGAFMVLADPSDLSLRRYQVVVAWGRKNGETVTISLQEPKAQSWLEGSGSGVRTTHQGVSHSNTVVSSEALSVIAGEE